jgi:hypothetical protein
VSAGISHTRTVTATIFLDDFPDIRFDRSARIKLKVEVQAEQCSATQRAIHTLLITRKRPTQSDKRAFKNWRHCEGIGFTNDV